MHGHAAPAPNVAKAYKNLDELLAQLRASFYTGPAAKPAAAEPRAAKDALAEADKPGEARGAGGQAAAPQPTPPEPEYEEYDDGLGARRSRQLCSAAAKASYRAAVCRHWHYSTSLRVWAFHAPHMLCPGGHSIDVHAPLA